MNKIAPVILLAFARLLPAAETVLELDPARTEIDFTVGTLVHTVHGTFALKKGVVHFDPANGKASGELVVDARSGNSGNSSRDKRMGKEVLQSVPFPEIVFLPDRVDGQFNQAEASQLQLHGQFRIHGVSHEMILPVRTEPVQSDLQATTVFSVPYVAWGMKNPTTLFLKVNDSVDVKIHAVGRLSTPSRVQ